MRSRNVPPHDLAGGGLGNVIDEFDGARVLVRRHALPAEGDQRLRVDGVANAQRDEGLHRLPAICVGLPDDGGLAHGVMGVEHVLHLPRPHLVAAGHDHVLLAVHQIEPAVFVHIADVTGQQSPVFEGGRGLFGLTPVARHDLRPRDRKLAELAGWQQRPVAVNHNDIGAEHRLADRQRPGLRIYRGLGAQRNAEHRGRRLRHPIDVVQVGAEACAEALEHA